MIEKLSDDQIQSLRRARLSYDTVGATSLRELPKGYGHLERSRILPGVSFGDAADHLMTWRVQEEAGLRVAASSAKVVEGSLVVMRLGLGPLSVQLPCKVVYVVNRDRRVGFAYGTLSGHAETGEERFLLECDEEGRVIFSVRAFSRAASRLARAGGPFTGWAQGMMTGRYLNAFSGLA